MPMGSEYQLQTEPDGAGMLLAVISRRRTGEVVDIERVTSGKSALAWFAQQRRAEPWKNVQ